MQDLLLLHGAIGSKEQFEPLKSALQNRFKIHMLNFSGHGDAAMNGDFSIPNFAAEVLQYLESNQIKSISVFGYSMGGYVALYLAKQHPEKITKVFTLATKFEWNPEISKREIKMLDASKIEEKIPAFASVLEKRHKNDWKIVLQKTAAMMIGLGENNPLALEDYAAIVHPVRIAIGDKDAMVSLEETVAVYRRLPNATFMVFPDTQHPIEKVDLERLSNELENFFF